MVNETLSILLKSLVPEKHKELTVMPYKKAYSHLLFTNFLAVIVILLISILMLPILEGTIDSRISSFKSLSVDLDVSSDSRVVFHSFPEFAVDLNKTEITSEAVMLNNNSLFIKPFSGKTFRVKWHDVDDLKENPSAVKNSFLILFLLMMPGILLFLFIANLLLTLVLVHISACVAWFVAKLLSFDIRFSQVLKISIYSITVLLIFYSLTLLFFYVWWIPVILYFLFLGFAVYITGEKQFSRDTRKGGLFSKHLQAKRKSHKDAHKDTDDDGYRMIKV